MEWLIIGGIIVAFLAVAQWRGWVDLTGKHESSGGMGLLGLADELFHACKGHGAWANGTRLQVKQARSLRDGVLGVGFSHRVKTPTFIPFLKRVLEDGGMFIRNGSGALMIAYVAAGRLIGYFEPHINSWDCLAGVVLVTEAGGVANPFFENDGLMKGNPILVAGDELYRQLEQISLPYCTPAET